VVLHVIDPRTSFAYQEITGVYTLTVSSAEPSLNINSGNMYSTSKLKLVKFSSYLAI
jgi:hypothetical protein